MKYIILLFLMLFSYELSAQRADCDSDLSCVGRAVTLNTIDITKPQYIDVLKTSSMENISDKLTIEMWVKPTRLSGKIQYIAGFWGPAEDVNDLWVLYINPADELVFELNSPNNNLQSLDNTVARASVATLYDTWYHIAAVFDGSSASAKLYVNGILSGFGSNNLYPAFRLRTPANKELGVIIGGTNAYTNDQENNRTFKGQIDEVRIWSKVFSDAEIYCMMNQSLNWSIQNLVLYYRCNEDLNSFVLCDASNNGNTGMVRSGGSIQNSNRGIQRTVFMEPVGFAVPFYDTLPCTGSRTYRFRVRDTSSCRKTVFMDVIGDYEDDFVITPDRFNNMVKDSIYEFTVTVNAEFQGSISPQLRAYSSNRCRFLNRVNLNLTRLNRLEYSNRNIRFDSLKAGCIEKPHIDSVLTIVNQTRKTGSAAPITISSISNTLTNVFRLSHPALPITIMPDDSIKINIRFVSGKFSSDNFDEIVINSDDFCSMTTRVPLSGKVKEVIQVRRGNGTARLDSIDFGKVCVDFPSDAALYNWYNLLEEDIEVIDIKYPEDVHGNQRVFPIGLSPQTGYMPSYFRFIPSKAGAMNDSIVFVINSDGCTIEWKIYVKGYGLFADVQFQQASVAFGNVIVGQESFTSIPVKNNSSETLRLSFYLKKGDAFFITNTTTVNLAPNEVYNINIGFRPSAESDYFDELCFFDGRCYESGCIPITGRGYLERFSFEPEILKLLNVVGCDAKSGNIEVTNLSPAALTIKNIRFENPSGKFSVVSPNPLPDEITIPVGGKANFQVRYAPNDVTLDRGEGAEIRFQSQDDVEWVAQIKGSSISPKLSAESPVLYGKIEVGELLDRKITIENISPFPVTLANAQVGNGFVILDDPTRYTNKIMQPRDTLILTIQFAPSEAKKYQVQLRLEMTEPCPKTKIINLSGEAEIIALEVPLNVLSYGFVLPCDCIEREVKLINRSKVFDMTIDNIFFTETGAKPESINYFEWTSVFYQANGNALPFNIPPGATDNLIVKYCPREPQNSADQSHSVFLNISGQGSSWQNGYSIYLSGLQALVYEVETDRINFNPTRVDTDAEPRFAELYFPNYLQNPYRDAVIIDTITFIPDERVFFAFDSEKFDLGENSYPTRLDSAGDLTLRFGFRPRSVRSYTAKARIAMRKLRNGGLCEVIDTTITLNGTGFAAAYGFSLNFGSSSLPIDTFRVISCEELVVPIFASREIPAEIVDIDLRLLFDTTKVELISAASPYLADSCRGYTPELNFDIEPQGASFLFKNFCNVDSSKAIAYLTFKPKEFSRDTFSILMDTVFFDTEEVILYHLIAALDGAIIAVLEPEIKILPDNDFLIIEFDSTRVLDCRELSFRAVNIGDVDISMLDVLELSSHFEIVNYSPPETNILAINDTVEITIRYCPRNVDEHISIFRLASSSPCFVIDSAEVRGIGFAPEFNPMYFTNNFEIMPDTVFTVLGDTISIPIYVNKDFSDTINGQFHSIKGLDFDIQMLYNKRALKYLGNRFERQGLSRIDYSLGNILFRFEGADDLRKGLILEPEFLVTVPDLVLSEMRINSSGYTSDSVLFFDFVPAETQAFLSIGDSCGIGRAVFVTPNSTIFPNPAGETFAVSEYSGGYEIIDILGNKVQAGIIEGKPVYIGNLPPGFYYIKLDNKVEKLIIRRE